MKIADIDVGEHVLVPYALRAVKAVTFRGERSSNFPRIEGWHRVRVLEIKPYGRLIVADEQQTYADPAEKVVKSHGFADWFFHAKKDIVMKVSKFEVASRSVRPVG